MSSATRARQVLVVPDSVGCLTSLDNFGYVTLLLMLACRDLTIISVWSTTFLYVHLMLRIQHL